MGLPEPLYLGSLTTTADPSRLLDLSAHTRDGVLILELEPSTPAPNTAAQMLAKVRRVSAELEAAPDLIRLLQVSCREVRESIMNRGALGSLGRQRQVG
jgi:two-component system, chemotaxis family, sensor kinase Cph1